MPDNTKLPASCQLLARLTTGGVEKATVDISRALVKSGAPVTVVSEGGRVLPDMLRAGATHLDLPVDGRASWTMIRHGWKLSRLLKQNRLKLIDLKTPARAGSALLARRIWPCRLVVTAHGAESEEGLEARRFRDALKKADRIIAISNSLADRLANKLDLDRDNITVIPQGIDLAYFNPGAIKAHRIIDLARKWRLPDDRPVMIVPCRPAPGRGQLHLIETLSGLKETPFTCLFLGDEENNSLFRKTLEAAVERHRLGGHVRFAGFCDDMPAAYMLADAVLIPARQSLAFSRAALEAQAMGRPVVTVSGGAAPELMANGISGWTYESGDAASFRAAILRALGRTADERAKLALMARDHVAPRFAAARMIDDTLALYSSLVR